MIDPQTYAAGSRTATIYAGDQRMAGYMPDIAKQGSDANAFAAMVRRTQQGGDTSGTSSSAAAASSSSSHGFMDFLTTLFDIINPLEHIPIISTIYEHVTGHHMNPVARIAGGALYGGPVGAAVGVADVMVEKSTGKDLGDNVLAMVSGKGGSKPAAPVALAQNAPITWDSTAKVQWDTPPTSTASLRGVDADVNTSANLALLQGQGNSATAPAPVPREQIAQQMMSGLDKYAALKHEQAAAAYSGTF
jgi:hypothetical protein